MIERTIINRALESAFQNIVDQRPTSDSPVDELQFKTVYRRVVAIATSLAEKPPSINTVKTVLETGIPIDISGLQFVAEVGPEKPLSGSTLKKLERTVDKKRLLLYERDSVVINRRRTSPSWKTGTIAFESRILGRTVYLTPKTEWEKQKDDKEVQEKAQAKIQLRNKMQIRIAKNQLRLPQEDPPLAPFIETLWSEPTKDTPLPTNAVFSMGFGISPTIPLRVASYPLLGYELLRQYPETRLELYIASQFSSLMAMTDTEAYRRAYEIQLRVSYFCKRFYPDIADRVTFLETQPLTPERSDLLDTFARKLQTVPELTGFAKQKSGWDSLRYMAAHSLYMRDPLPIQPELYFVPLPTDRRPVVMIGGRAETIMWRARKTILSSYGVLTEPLQLFTAIGGIPPYVRKNNEPSVTDDLTLQFLRTTTPEQFRDFASMFRAIATNEGYVDLWPTQTSPSRSELINNVAFQEAMDTYIFVMSGGETIGQH